MFSNNLAGELKNGICSILGVLNPLDTGRYLGLPSLVGKSKKQIFIHLKDKLRDRLKIWRQRSISKAGRSTLIRSAAQSIPVYYMSVFLIPESTIDELEKILNTFWWSNKKDGARSINWMSWDKMCVPKKFGGLAYRDFSAFNLSMLCKQGWRLLTNPDTLVSRIFKAKYYPTENFLEARLGHSPSYIWRSVWSAQKVLKLGCRWKVGDGSDIRVWRDPWLRHEGFSVSSTPHSGGSTLRVCHLGNGRTGTWNSVHISNLFNNKDQQRIMQLPPPNVGKKR